MMALALFIASLNFIMTVGQYPSISNMIENEVELKKFEEFRTAQNKKE